MHSSASPLRAACTSGSRRPSARLRRGADCPGRMAVDSRIFISSWCEPGQPGALRCLRRPAPPARHRPTCSGTSRFAGTPPSLSHPPLQATQHSNSGNSKRCRPQSPGNLGCHDRGPSGLESTGSDRLGLPATGPPPRASLPDTRAHRPDHAVERSHMEPLLSSILGEQDRLSRRRRHGKALSALGPPRVPVLTMLDNLSRAINGLLLWCCSQRLVFYLPVLGSPVWAVPRLQGPLPRRPGHLLFWESIRGSRL